MDWILFHQLKSLLNVVLNSFKGFEETQPQPVASLTEPILAFSQCNDTASNRDWLSSSMFLDYLSKAEAQEIIQQFESISRDECELVFWTGIPRERAQEWADARGMLTLTTMMGPLRDTSNARCQRSSKGTMSWRKYVKGASIIFSLYGSGAGTVTVLTIPPPLQLVDIRPECTFISLEEPILKGKLGGLHAVKIKFVHHIVKGAEDFAYQVWPTDCTNEWTERFGAVIFTFRHWGGRTIRTENTACEQATNAQPVRGKVEAESSTRSKQMEKARNVMRTENAKKLKQVRKLSNIVETEGARRLRQVQKARNKAEAEKARMLKEAQRARNMVEAEKARRLRQAQKARNVRRRRRRRG